MKRKSVSQVFHKRVFMSLLKFFMCNRFYFQSFTDSRCNITPVRLTLTHHFLFEKFKSDELAVFVKTYLHYKNRI